MRGKEQANPQNGSCSKKVSSKDFETHLKGEGFIFTAGSRFQLKDPKLFQLKTAAHSAAEMVLEVSPPRGYPSVGCSHTPRPESICSDRGTAKGSS